VWLAWLVWLAWRVSLRDDDVFLLRSLRNGVSCRFRIGLGGWLVLCCCGVSDCSLVWRCRFLRVDAAVVGLLCWAAHTALINAARQRTRSASFSFGNYPLI
jgi:hypothetical protein